MGNTCEPCLQDNYSEPNQLACSHFVISEENCIDTEIPINDNFFVSYVSQSFHSYPVKKLKKDLKTNQYFYGDWVQGLPNGRGILYQPNRKLIESNFVNGMPCGHSRIIFIDKKRRYEGQLKQGKIQGNGIMLDENQGYKFEGTWKNSSPQSGTLTLFNDKNIQKVDFISYTEQIRKIIYKDGRVYEGQIDWNQLVPHGKGKVKFGTFDVKDNYQGEWKNGTYDGAGAFFWKNGEYYTGEYRNGRKHGQGRYKFMTGNQYEGGWLNGKQNGQGCIYDKSGFKIKSGVWREGTYSSGQDRFHHHRHYVSNFPNSSIQLNGLKSMPVDQVDQINEQFIQQNIEDIVEYHIKRTQSQNQDLKMENLRKRQF